MDPDLHSAPFEVFPPAALDGPTMVVPESGDPPEASTRSAKWLLEWVAVLLVALVLAIGVRMFVAQMFYIPSGSMEPTLEIGDRIVVDKLSYDFHNIDRGDIVVFQRPPLEQANYSDLVKRVIGLPGDTISSVGGRVYIDGKPLSEPWLPTPAPITSPSPLPDGFSLNHPYVVPPGMYFVMGDNRTDSADSRYFGPIPKSLIVGKMAFKVWPLSNTTWLVALTVVALVLLVLLVVVLRSDPPARRGGRHSTRGPPGPASAG